MNRRYSVRGVMYGAEQETEICQVDQNPENVVEALKQITLMVHSGKPGARRRTRMPKYSSVRVVDLHEAAA